MAKACGARSAGEFIPSRTTSPSCWWTKRALNLSDTASLLPGLPRGAEILIIRLRSVGDVVLLTPAISALHSWRPDLRISVLVEAAWGAVLEGNPAVSEV